MQIFLLQHLHNNNSKLRCSPQIQLNRQGSFEKDILCLEAYGTCDTASPEYVHPKDARILKDARAKLTKKTVSTTLPPGSSSPE